MITNKRYGGYSVNGEFSPAPHTVIRGDLADYHVIQTDGDNAVLRLKPRPILQQNMEDDYVALDDYQRPSEDSGETNQMFSIASTPNSEW